MKKKATTTAAHRTAASVSGRSVWSLKKPWSHRSTRGVTGRLRPLGPRPLRRPASVDQRRPRWSRGSGYPTT
eukprot:4856187-Pyramimonas_sp.AAC.1